MTRWFAGRHMVFLGFLSLGNTGEHGHLLFYDFGHFDKLIFKPNKKRQLSESQSDDSHDLNVGEFAVVETSNGKITGLQYFCAFLIL